MASFLQTSPQGFFTANEALNSYPLPVVKSMIREALDNLVSRSGSGAASLLVEKYTALLSDASAESAELQLSRAPTLRAVDGCIHAVNFVLSGAIRHQANAPDFEAELKKSTCLNVDVVKAFVSLWSAEGIASKELGSSTLDYLVGFDWKLGLGVSSSHCKTLEAPFVDVKLNIASPAGDVRAYPMELDLDEFEDFAKSIRDICRQLDAV
jgi:hypothetical protein